MAMRYSTVPKKSRYEHVVLNEDRVPEIAGTRLVISGKHWSAVITYRGERVRLISVRRARAEEVAIYES